MGVMFGILAAVLWGVGDFLITHLTRRVGTTRALVAIQALSLLAWIGLLLSQPARSAGTPALWLIVAGTAVCHVLGLVFVYRAFEIGTLSLVSPISSGFAVITAVLAMLSGEHAPAPAIAGAALLVAGVVLATRAPGSGQAFTLRGVPEALLSALAFGTMFWLFYFYVQPNLGYALPLKRVAYGNQQGWNADRADRDPSQHRPAGAGGSRGGHPRLAHLHLGHPHDLRHGGDGAGVTLQRGHRAPGVGPAPRAAGPASVGRRGGGPVGDPPGQHVERAEDRPPQGIRPPLVPRRRRSPRLPGRVAPR